MKPHEVQELRQCTLTKRTSFHYFKDRYALELLRYFIGDGLDIGSVKRSPYAQLLKKGVVKEVVTSNGGGFLRSDHLHKWPQQFTTYYLSHAPYGSKSRWSYGYRQTTRRGLNLALHLNFSSQHDDMYRDLIRPEPGENPFVSSSHPRSRNYNTLAWARIDVDLHRGEALIEEIQSDWLRYAYWTKRYLHRVRPEYPEGKTIAQCFPQRSFSRGLNCSLRHLDRYVDSLLDDYGSNWDEAMLLASIWYLKEEVGISKIYYHTSDSGWRLKRIRGRKPPRSIYSKLPKKFCFVETRQPPQCVAENPEGYLKHVLKLGIARWYLLEL